MIILWLLPRIYKPPVLNVVDTQGSTDRIYGPSVKLPIQKKQKQLLTVRFAPKQDRSGNEGRSRLVNMIASVFLRYLFIGMTLLLILRDECFLEATGLLFARLCSLVDLKAKGAAQRDQAARKHT